jgi:hypothetical protein
MVLEKLAMEVYHGRIYKKKGFPNVKQWYLNFKPIYLPRFNFQAPILASIVGLIKEKKKFGTAELKLPKFWLKQSTNPKNPQK